MTLEDKISQMFFPKYVPENATEDLPNLKPGGYVLYADHFNHPAEYVLNYIEEMNNISMANLGSPLGLVVDEEGGIVCRVSKFHRESGNFPSPQQIYNESGIEGILKIDQEKRDLLRKFLLNVNLAPVADLSYTL
jgi:beta-N-acetylhexosaminidase